MSRLISDILEAPEPHFSHNLRRLEDMSGRPGHDIRLVAEVSAARRALVISLGLDQDDTTAKELYYALRHKAAETNAALESRVGITPQDTSEEVLVKVIKFVDTLPVSRDVWTVKQASLKTVLKKQPPKKLMKVLGFRSIESVLKRTTPSLILPLARQTESSEWQQKLQAAYKRLGASDFTSGKSKVFPITRGHIEKLRKNSVKLGSLVLLNPEAGTVLIMQPARRFKYDTLAVTLILIQSLYELKAYSAFFRHSSVKPSFGKVFCDAIFNGLPGKISNSEIGWKTLQRYFKNNPHSFEEVEQPFFQLDDTHLASPAEVLKEKIPEAEFWTVYEYIFMPDSNKPVSAHLMDVVLNAINDLPYEKSVHYHLQNALWDELAVRYLQNRSVRAAVLESLGE